jgi:hypothetical protein
VWHCSVAVKVDFPLARRETIAREVLEGAGDPRLGEWTEDAPLAYHLRRRLTDAEARDIGPAIAVAPHVAAMARAEVGI